MRWPRPKLDREINLLAYLLNICILDKNVNYMYFMDQIKNLKRRKENQIISYHIILYHMLGRDFFLNKLKCKNNI